MKDILQELPLNEWPKLQEKLKSLWPSNFPGYYTLRVNQKYPKVREAFQFKVYCPYGDINNGFIGINYKGAQECILFSATEDTIKLEEAIIKTKLIDWSNRISFELLTPLTIQVLESVRDQVGFTTFNIEMAITCFLERTAEPFSDLKLPEDVYAAPVKLGEIKLVDDTWPYRHSASFFYFTTLASNGLSYGIYSHENELLSWVFINEYNFICHLYCRKGYRRKGYAEYVMKWAVNDQLNQGNDVYAYVVHGNEKPLELFKKIGFKIVDKAALLFVEK